MRKNHLGFAAALFFTAVLAVGCGESKEKYELREAGIEQLDAGNYEEAIAVFEEAIEKSDGLVGEFEIDVLKYRAEAEYKAGDYDASAYTYDVLCQVDEERPEYRIRSCMLNSKAGAVEKALEDYDKVQAMKSEKQYQDTPEAFSEFSDAILSLGQAFIEAERYDEAVALCEEQTAVGGGSGELYNQLGLALMNLGQYDQALEYLERGIRSGDEAVMQKLLYNQAAVYEKKLDFASALTVLEDYAARYGTTPEIEKELAFLRTR